MEKTDAARKIRTAAAKRQRTQREWEQAMKDANEKAGMSLREIAPHAGVTYEQVRRVLAKLTAMSTLLLLVLAAPAFAKLTAADPAPYATRAHTRLVLPDGSTPRLEQAWANRSLLPPFRTTVHLVLGRCPGDGGADATGCAYGPDYGVQATVYLHGPISPFDLLHELGHIFDNTQMTDLARIRFRAIMHDRNPNWWLDPGPFYSSPAERFADAYALCALRRHLAPDSLDNNLRWLGAEASDFYGYHPTESQHRKVCKLIRQVAGA